MSLSSWWNNLFKKKVVHVNIDDESMSNYNFNQAIINENAELKSTNAKLESEKQKRRQTEEDSQDENRVKSELIERKSQLQRNEGESYLSLGKFFNKYSRDKKFQKSLYFTSFDRKSRLARFKDIGLADNGDLVFLKEDGSPMGSPMMRMSRAKDMLQSPGALIHDLKSGAIPINVDKDGIYVENILEVWEAPEVIKGSDGNLKYAKAKKKLLYELIQEKAEQINELHEDLSDSEEVIVNLEKEKRDLERDVKRYSKAADVAQNELSKNEQEISSVNKNFSNVTKELTKLRDVTILAEEKINLLEKNLGESMKLMEDEATKLPYRRAMELIRDLRSEIVNQQVRIEMPKMAQPERKTAENS